MKARVAFPIFVFLVFLILGIVIGVSNHRALSGSSDFDVYYYAGKSILAGEPIYTISRHAVSLSKSPFVYPPFFAYLMSSLSLFPIGVSASIWNLFSLFAFACSLILMTQLFKEEKGQPFRFQKPYLFWQVLFLVLILSTLLDNLMMAQVNLLVFFLILLGIDCYQKNRLIRTGFWIGVASAVKLIPLIFFIYFLIQRKWKALAGGFLAAVLCLVVFPLSVVGPQRSLADHEAWMNETIHDHVTPKTLGFYASQLNPSHQNLQAVIFRLMIDWEFREATGGPNGKRFLFRTPIRLSEMWAGRVAMAVCGVLFLVLLFALARIRSPEMSKTMFFSVVSCILSAMVLLSPKVRSHFFVFLLFPWSVLLERIIQPKETGKGLLGEAAHSAAFPSVQIRSGSALLERDADCAARRCVQIRLGFVQLEKLVFLGSAALYFLQAVEYFKFLGAGCWSVLVLFIYFVQHLIRKPSNSAE